MDTNQLLSLVVNITKAIYVTTKDVELFIETCYWTYKVFIVKNYVPFQYVKKTNLERNISLHLPVGECDNLNVIREVGVLKCYQVWLIAKEHFNIYIENGGGSAVHFYI